MSQSIETILKYMPISQALCFVEGLNGEEGSYFQEVAKNISEVIEKAPALYETDGKGEEVKPVLHYFWGNVDIYVTEIDRETQQHFGYASLGLGYFEAGYIDLSYIFESIPLLNLDFYFTPKTIAEYRKIYEG